MPDISLARIAIGLGGVVALLLTAKYWSDSNSNDLGTMSEKWLAEHNASHP